MEHSTISLLTDDELDSVAAAGFSWTSIRIAASYQSQEQENNSNFNLGSIVVQGGSQSQQAVNNSGVIYGSPIIPINLNG